MWRNLKGALHDFCHALRRNGRWILVGLVIARHLLLFLDAPHRVPAPDRLIVEGGDGNVAGAKQEFEVVVIQLGIPFEFWYGNWWAVLIQTGIFALFLLGFTRPRGWAPSPGSLPRLPALRLREPRKPPLGLCPRPAWAALAPPWGLSGHGGQHGPHRRRYRPCGYRMGHRLSGTEETGRGAPDGMYVRMARREDEELAKAFAEYASKTPGFLPWQSQGEK